MNTAGQGSIIPGVEGEREARQRTDHAATFGSATSCDGGLRHTPLLAHFHKDSKFRTILGRTHVKRFGLTAVFGGLTSIHQRSMRVRAVRSIKARLPGPIILYREGSLVVEAARKLPLDFRTRTPLSTRRSNHAVEVLREDASTPSSSGSQLRTLSRLTQQMTADGSAA